MHKANLIVTPIWKRQNSIKLIARGRYLECPTARNTFPISQLARAKLLWSKPARARLKEANLQEASFYDANLQRSNLTRADLRRARH
jgi:uncharacterized protein YjbI with pentapeptide repeats